MTQKGFSVLKSIVEAGDTNFIDKIIIGRDTNISNDYHDEIKRLCTQSNIKCFTRSENISVKSDFAIAVSWRWVINSISEFTKLIILHDSILPKYRGFSPLVNTLIAGEEEIGVTAFFATDDFDKGDIIAQKKLTIKYPLKIAEAINKITPIYSSIVIGIIHSLKENKRIESRPQNEKEASYSLWRDSKDYFINWNWSSEKIARFVNALGDPYDGAKCMLEQKVIRINEIELYPDLYIENRDVGKVLMIKKNRPIVVCKKGLVRIVDAEYINEGVSIFPLKKFRNRFQ